MKIRSLIIAILLILMVLSLGAQYQETGHTYDSDGMVADDAGYVPPTSRNIPMPFIVVGLVVLSVLLYQFFLSSYYIRRIEEKYEMPSAAAAGSILRWWLFTGALFLFFVGLDVLNIDSMYLEWDNLKIRIIHSVIVVVVWFIIFMIIYTVKPRRNN